MHISDKIKMVKDPRKVLMILYLITLEFELLIVLGKNNKKG